MFQIELEFGNVGFLGEGKTRVPGEKPLGAKERTNNKLKSHGVNAKISTWATTVGGRGGGRVLSPLQVPCSASTLLSMDAATLYFHLLRSICTVTLRLKIFTHGFYIYLFFGNYGR